MKLCLTLFVVSLLAAPAWAGEKLFFQGLGAAAPRAPAYVQPGRLFSLNVPDNWQARTFADRPDFVEFRIVGGPGTAWLQVQRQNIAEGARARQLLLRALEGRLKKLPHFRENGRRDVTLNGIKGASVTGDYWYQGNAEYPRAIEEIFLVIGKDAFELHFECFEPISGVVAQELDRVYNSFVARPAATPGPGAPVEDDQEDPLDNIPF